MVTAPCRTGCRLPDRFPGAGGLETLGGAISEAAWRVKPSRYLHVTVDKLIPPAAHLIH
ncbi:hypothetical protein ACFV4K_08460 [Nocardia sp. NPDC059764]|uniref:hypothetical protein n=1 Tax=Nocardia sp. NPDC059764 TaxID=3346939 RepID=UPI003669D6AC